MGTHRVGRMKWIKSDVELRQDGKIMRVRTARSRYLPLDSHVGPCSIQDNTSCDPRNQ